MQPQSRQTNRASPCVLISRVFLSCLCGVAFHGTSGWPRFSWDKLTVRVAHPGRRRIWERTERHGSCTPRLAVVTRSNGAPHATGIATEVALEPKTATVVSLPRILKGPIVCLLGDAHEQIGRDEGPYSRHYPHNRSMEICGHSPVKTIRTSRTVANGTL